MIFPFSKKKSFPDPFDPARRLDREVCGRVRRLAIGVALESDLQTLHGALVVFAGQGKYMRVIRALGKSKALPSIATSMLKKIVASEEPSLLDLRAVQSDIAMVQTELAEELKREAGKCVDRLSMIAASDPGLWIDETQSRPAYWPICDPNLLADATGITVIDAFPTRDIAAGGSGRILNALPAWLLWADRNDKQAQNNRLVIVVDRTASAYFLPASDGLDVECPDVRVTHSELSEFLFRLLELNLQGCERSDIVRLSVEGSYDEHVAKILRSGSHAAWLDHLQSGEVSIADCVRTLLVELVEQISSKIRDQLADGTSIHELIVAGDSFLKPALVNQFNRTWPEATIVDPDGASGISACSSSAIFVAMLGMMAVDQMPANIPWVTGASSQKILGRLTAGTPTNWRQILVEMADFQPPAMRLRDAV